MLDQATTGYAMAPEQTAPLCVREKSGVVYTKRWVVELLLDLAGYLPEKALAGELLVEPSAGDGSFLLGAVARLIESCLLHKTPLIESKAAIIAYELDAASADRARRSVSDLLLGAGAKEGDADVLVDSWIRTGDYLLESRGMRSKADFVIGNPPYIRLEDLEDGGLLYRSAYPTMKGRADIYVAFFEAALRQLAPGGVCGFICADRWMFNQYGGELRKLVASGFSVETVAQMHQADAFEDQVSAYPAVTIIRRAPQGSVVVASLSPGAERKGVRALVQELSGSAGSSEATNAARLEKWFKGSGPWSLIEPGKQALLRRLEAEFPMLEATSARVGIGIATGADNVFITSDAGAVESERMLPLTLAQDVRGGEVAWSGTYLVNPWNGRGLVDLNEYPKLQVHFEKYRERLEKRHVGKRNPGSWYRTIDRVDHALIRAEKLYLPDMATRIAPVLDSGGTYPHHNLYFITPGLWDARALGGLLLSDVAQFFVEAYGVRMRGGYLRFQAQYLRRISLPYVSDVSSAQAKALIVAFETRDVAAANAVAAELYGLSKAEQGILGY
ncbi:MAG TPA: Eco57I restriction-modification methylase domain-containing protein [Fimbriimonadaceae bacterium]|nr:Eco57I restriction-modification methylase domain-containing protein [Fimbriimonadaceae bacterium]